jgi:hypothetical protein
LKGDQSRVAIKAEAARKKKARKLKKTRRKYRELEGKEGDKDADGKLLEEEEVEILGEEVEVKLDGKEEKEVDVDSRVVEESKGSGKSV